MSQNLSPEEIQKRIRLVRYWLFGLFIIVFVATMIYFGYLATAAAALAGVSGSTILWGLQGSWPIWAITGILCLVVAFGYQYWLTRKA